MANKMLLKKNKIENAAFCAICAKTATVGLNRPHSLHKTKKIIKPNLQKVQGLMICTRCLRTQTKKSA